MGTIVDATVPTDQFALRDTFERMPDARFETVRVVAHGTRHVMPFLWATADDFEGLGEALSEDSTTEHVDELARGEDRSLYFMQWQPRIRVIVYVLVEEQGTLLGANGHDDHWRLRVLFPERESVSSAYDFCKAHGIELSIRRVNELDELMRNGGRELSNEQYEALTTAFESDYYGVPRGTTLEELSENLGVSHQALSERLRRGHRNLIESTLQDGETAIEHVP